MPFAYPSLAERLIANSISMLYGKFMTRFTRGKNKGKVRTMLAHRVAVRELKGRYVSPRQVVMHLCNWSLCINPAHLVGGTQRKNVRQAVREGRHRNGASAAAAERAAIQAANEGDYGAAYGHAQDAEILRRM